VALRLKPLTDGIPLDITVVATHAVAGHIAVEAGFRKVINLVVDNYAQHFNAVPGAINAVQADADPNPNRNPNPNQANPNP
jgi:hypothetical protein